MSIFVTLREQVTLEEIVGRAAEIRGGKARCVAPDHEDSDPSMHLYGDHVHCFSCDFHGDVVDVWAAMQGFDRPLEAAHDLAREYGVELPDVSAEARRKDAERREQESRYLKQARACHRALDRHPRVRVWWEGRGFGEELQARFLLGTNHDGSEAIIPFWQRGRIWGLVRRKLEGEPKYVYPTREEFAGGHRPLFIPGPLRPDTLLVEGIIDALAASALGESVVAAGGTNISREHTEELRRIPGLLYVLPDDDEKGAEASRRWVRALYPKALLCLPEYGEDSKDLADLLRNRGNEAAQEVLKELKTRAADALDLALSEAPDGSTRARYRYAKWHVVPLLCQLKDEGEREAAIKDAADSLKLKVGQLRSVLEALEGAESAREPVKPEAEPIPEEADALVSVPGVLDLYVEDVARIRRVVKDRCALKLQTLVALSAQLAPLPGGRPAGANLILTAESGRGKNYICDAVATGLPESFFLDFESASARSLFYRAEDDSEVLKHRWIYPNEAEGTDELVEMFRPLLSGGKASHLTVNKTGEGRNAAQELNVEGPVSLTIPTVRNKLDAQLQTRMLVAELPDYEGRVAEHSRAVSRQLLPDRADENHEQEIRAWHAALRSLTAIRRVVFDLDREEFCFDSDQVSHGARLWANLLGLMLTHAWLEQRNREIIELSSGERAVVATPDDYRAAYNVFKATCERSVINLSDTHRKILTAVYELKGEKGLAEGFSQRKIAARADVSVSTVSEHKTYLTKSVKLLRVADEGLALVADAEPSWWEKEDLLLGFPRPEQVRAWCEEARSASAPQTAERAEQDADEAHNTLGQAENGVRRSAELPPNGAEHLISDMRSPDGVRQEAVGARQGTEHGNGLGKRETMSDEQLFGMFGDFEDGDRSRDSCIHNFAGGKGCYLCDPNHPYRLKVQ
jgi:transcriptional regulator with XRE-family HTH domain